MNTAVHFRNRCTISDLIEKTAYEMWMKKQPDISYFRVFGSIAMVYIAKEKHQKWNKKSLKKNSVGYGEDVEGYRVYDTVTYKVTTSRDVLSLINLTMNFLLH